MNGGIARLAAESNMVLERGYITIAGSLSSSPCLNESKGTWSVGVPIQHRSITRTL